MTKLRSFFVLVLALLAMNANATIAAENSTDFLDREAVAKILSPGAVWCFEPLGTSCYFLTISVTFDKQVGTYDVISKLAPDLLLVQHVSWKLLADGLLCEQAEDYVKDYEVTDLAGVPVGEQIHNDVGEMLDDALEARGVTEHCYRYIERSDGRLTQVQFDDGVDIHDNAKLLMDYDSDALSRYHVRDPLLSPPTVAKLIY